MRLGKERGLCSVRVTPIVSTTGSIKKTHAVSQFEPSTDANDLVYMSSLQVRARGELSYGYVKMEREIVEDEECTVNGETHSICPHKTVAD